MVFRVYSAVSACGRVLLLAGVLLHAGCDSVEERAEKHYERGLELAGEGDLARAALEFRNALKLDQQFIPAHLELATLFAGQRNFRGAIAHLTRITELDPGHVQARIMLARIMMVGDKLDEADGHLAAAFETDRRHPDVLATKAAVALMQGRRAEALSAAGAALEIDPGNADAGMVLARDRIDAGYPDQALELVQRFLAEDAGNFALNVAKLELLQSLGDEDLAVAHLRHLTELFPDRPEFRRVLAQEYERMGKVAEAEMQLRALAEAAPSNIGVSLDVARFLARTDGFEAGRAELERLAAAATDRIPYDLALVQLHRLHGRDLEGEALLEEVIARGGDPEGLNAARVELARFRLAGGDQAGALELVDAVIAEDARNVDALAIRAALLIDANDYDAAILDLRTALAEAPRNVTLLQLSASAEARNGNVQLAGERLAVAMQASGYAPAVVLHYVNFLRERGETQVAQAVLEEAALRRPDKLEILAALGTARLERNDWSGVEEVAEKLRALGVSQADLAADRLLAAALSGRGRYAETLDVLRQISENSDDARSSTMAPIVETYVSAGQERQAVAFIEDRLAEDPGNVQALQLRGMLHQRAGESEAAEARYRTAVAAQPDNPSVYATLARFYLSENRTVDALSAVRDGLAAVPEDPGLTFTLAAVLETRGDFDKATELYGRLLETHPDSLVAANNFASLVADHRADDPESLARAFTVAKRLRNSKLPAYQDTYGWLQYLRGDFDGALRSLLPVADALPDNPWVRYHLGMTYAKLGVADKARPHLEAALALAGDGPFSKSDEVRDVLGSLPSE